MCLKARSKDWVKRGQVVVEMILILPVFLTMIFTIMEMGYLAFWVITLNHATYEVARIGALVATPRYGGAPRAVNADMQRFMGRIIRSARVTSYAEPSVYDHQADVQNHDLVVTGSYRARLVFPISRFLLSSPPGSGFRLLQTTVRMPIEQPLERGDGGDKSLRGGRGGRFRR
jgi:Flp pilus assembly protein TadG